MRYLSQYRVFENIAQARLILRRNNISIDNDDFKKIIAKTNRDGYTGLLTRLVFEDGVDVNEIIGIYDDLKGSGLNLAEISKLSYDQILDKIYPDKRSANYELVFQYKNYNCYLIKNYQGILEIGSPSWCLKTKSHYDSYTNNGKNLQFVLIRKDKISNNKIKLMSPELSTDYEISGYRSINPDCRYGITVRNNKLKTVDIFNDNNINTIDPDILQKVKEWARESGFINISTGDNFVDYIVNMVSEIISDVNPLSFSYMFNDIKDRKMPISYVRRFLNQNPPKFWKDVTKEEYWNKFLNEYSSNRIEIGDSEVSNMCGLADIILYELDILSSATPDDAHPLYGIRLRECEESESIIKYMYGYQNAVYGIEMIKQSYGSIESWYEFIGNEVIKNEIIVSYYFDMPTVSKVMSLFYNEMAAGHNRLSLRSYIGTCTFCTYLNNKVVFNTNTFFDEMREYNTRYCHSVANNLLNNDDNISNMRLEIADELKRYFNKDFSQRDGIITFSL